MNDHAERWVSLIQNYYSQKKDETRLQYLMRIVENNIKNLPSMKKKCLVKFLEGQ